ncbi:MAG TPA: oxidoreductase, partial [Polyangiaceae bacterium]|nr:oxidoreductase [Polyangiaceae bacterium]
MKATEIEECIRVLEALVDNRAALSDVDIETRNRLFTAAGRLSRPGRTEQRLLSRALQKKQRRAVREAEAPVLASTLIRKKRQQPLFITPEPKTLTESAGSFSDAEGWEEPELTNA